MGAKSRARLAPGLLIPSASPQTASKRFGKPLFFKNFKDRRRMTDQDKPVGFPSNEQHGTGVPGQAGSPAAGDEAAATDGTGGAASSGDPVAALQAKLAQAEARVQENLDLYMRALAEMENVRKRSQNDVANAHKYAIEAFAESLLPVKDSLEMALKVESPSVESIQEGVEATLRLLSSVFEKNKLLEINPVNDRFDPNRHQAISTVPAADVAPNHVVSVLQKGYLINDRVLRPALVTVKSGS
jgi:molecular chaperone GrpE